MKEKIKKLLRKIIIKGLSKCVFNYLCDFIMMCVACLYPVNAIAIHILLQNPYSMIILHFCLFKTFIIVVNIIKQIWIMYEKKNKQ